MSSIELFARSILIARNISITVYNSVFVVSDINLKNIRYHEINLCVYWVTTFKVGLGFE